MSLLGLAALLVLAAPSMALALPDGRGYEMVTPVDKNGNEVGPGTPSTDGNSVDWQAIGGCCGATSAASTLYRSTHSASGWQTTAMTPTPPNPLVGLFEEQQPVWYSSDLAKTIYTTPASYAAGDNRPPSPSAGPYLDLYEQGRTSPFSMDWLTQGPFAGAGTNPDAATFSAATPDGNTVAFDTPEQLTADATGLASLSTPPQYLYVRNISAGTTSLVDVTSTTLTAAVAGGGTTTTIPVASTNLFATGQTVTIGLGPDSETDTIAAIPDSTDITLNTAVANNHASGETVDALLGPDGAIAGNGNWLDQGFEPADLYGTTTNSISSDGSKVFFETPPTFAGGGGSAEGVGPSHLYMRNLTTQTTTAIDDPTSSGGAVYEGASQDGSLVFFTSDEGLAGDPNTDNELYEFNTNTGTVTPLSTDSSGDDGNVVGLTAISNDGSHVWFVAKGVLDTTPNPQGETAAQGANNFYEVDTSTATPTPTFIGALGSGVVGDNRDKTALTAEPDINRAAIPTPNGNVMVFESSANLTNQNPTGPSTTLTADVPQPTDENPVSIQVDSSAGFVVGRSVEIETGIFPESATITAIPDSTHLTVTDTQLAFFPPTSGDSVTQLPPFEVYRYKTADNSLTCVSCTPAGVTPTGGAGLGASYGGSYEPAYEGVPMSSDGSRIFFTSPDPLTPGVISSPPIPIGLFGGLAFVSNVYEWENGTVSLISDGQSSTGSSLGSTTPSGNDVFFTTEDQLVPQDLDGYDDIYDARVGGGFPPPPGTTAPCAAAQTCRSSVAPTVFFPVPASSTLVNANVTTPSFRVNSLSAKQRKHLAQTGAVTLTIHATQAGKISVVLSAAMKGGRMILDTVNRSLHATGGGQTKVTLHLGKAARRVLATKHRLVVDISVSYSQSNVVDVAKLTLTTKHKAKAKDVTKRSTSKPRPARER